MSTRGFVRLPVVISIALGAGFLASVFLNITQHQQAAQDKKLLQGEITDLRYQVNQDKLAAAGSPSPSPSVTPLATPEASPSPSAAPTPSPTAVLDASTKTTTVKKSGNVHVGPSVSSKTLIPYTQLPAGTTVTLGEKSGDYQQITVNGVTGYILASYLN